MSFASSKIFSRDTKGNIRFWFYEVADDKWRGVSGLERSDKLTASGWSRAKPKNVGKKNQRTAEEQAQAEAAAEETKKLGREYRRTIEELDNVPPAPMLAHKYQDLKTPLRYHPGGYLRVQPKLDGIRMLSSERFGLYSREYQPFGEPVDHIREALAPIFKAYPGIHLDGELYNHKFHDDFNSISSLVRTDHPLNEGERLVCRQYLQYHIYDLLDPTLRFSQRSELIEQIDSAFSFEFTPLVRVPTYIVDHEGELDGRYMSLRGAGYEGLIIRPDEAYEPGVRSWNLIKRKEKITDEFALTRLIMGDGNWDGIPKAVEYILPGDRRDADGNRPKASIKGSMEFCKTLIALDPKFATIEYFALTPGGIPRFPVAVDFHKEGRTD